MGQVSYFFIDTNILLHFRPVTEIPWHEIVQGERIELVITQGVIRDLDKHKSTNPSQKIRNRARRVLSEIEKWTKNPNGFEIRPKVGIKVRFELPTIDLTEYNLDQNWSDDYLLAVIKSFQLGSGGSSVWIVSDDTGIRIKAQHLGISPLVLEEVYRLPCEPDPLEAENQRLKHQILKLSTPSTPDLTIEFSDGQSFVRFPLPAVPSKQEVEQEISAKIEEVKKKYQPYSEHHFLGLAPALAAPSKQEIQRYNVALPKYYSAYEEYLRRIALLDLRRSLIFEFTLQLSNVGRAPADDIDIQIYFSDGFSFQEEVESTDSIQQPKPPPPPRSAFQLTKDEFMISFEPPKIPVFTDSIFRKLGSVSPPPNVSSARIKKTNSYEVSYTVKRLKHGFSASLGTLGIFFDRHQDVRSFEADYVVNASNMPEDSKGKLRFAFISTDAA